MKRVVQQTARRFKYGVAMPNTNPPIFMPREADAYREEIMGGLTVGQAEYFCPIRTLYLTEETTPADIVEAWADGIRVIKLFPRDTRKKSGGGTTNSGHGIAIKNIKRLTPTFAEMEHRGEMILSIHGQVPEAYCQDAEEAFLPTLDWLSRTFPGLTIIFEHVSTEAGVNYILRSRPNVRATVTAHHLAYTLDDIFSGGINPHNYCLPLVGRPEDREVIRFVVLSGHPKFFFGSDSAPHEISAKICLGGKAGCYSAPTALEYVVQLFMEHQAHEHLEGFISERGPLTYSLTLPAARLVVVKKRWKVPPTIDGLVPFMAGRTLEYQVAGLEQ